MALPVGSSQLGHTSGDAPRSMQPSHTSARTLSQQQRTKKHVSRCGRGHSTSTRPCPRAGWRRGRGTPTRRGCPTSATARRGSAAGTRPRRSAARRAGRARSEATPWCTRQTELEVWHAADRRARSARRHGGGQRPHARNAADRLEGTVALANLRAPVVKRKGESVTMRGECDGTAPPLAASHPARSQSCSWLFS